MGFLDKLGGDSMQQMILFGFLGLLVAILILGFHRSPAPAPNPAGTGLHGTTAMPQLTKANQNMNIGRKTTGGYL